MTFNYSKLTLTKDAEISDASKAHFDNKDKRYGFRCDYHYADGRCYGGSDGGNCPSGRRRRSVPSKVKMKMKNQFQQKFSLAKDGECGPSWMEIMSQEKCEDAADILGLKFKMRHNNTGDITGCIATGVFEEKGDETVEKSICQRKPTRPVDTTEASHPSTRVQLKRAKRQAGV